MTDLSREQEREHALQRALDSLEACAGTPFVPGEMVAWLRATDHALERLYPLVSRQISQVHSAQYAEISQEDPELLRQVEILQQEDQAILEQLSSAQSRMELLRPLVQRVEPDEKRAESAMAEFAQTLLDLVQRLRKQEVALRTWLVEAFTRDRGAVD
jgi:septal ring factor EnvC (AmiA/AmiB activator)